MELSLKGHTALITGGATGIGLATARGFAEEGCDVVLWDLSPEVESVAEQIADDFKVDTSAAVVDVADFDGVQVAAERLTDGGRRIDHVVHCAAVGSGKYGFPFTKLAPKDWTKSIEVNVMGMVHVAHALTPSMVESGSGTFVFLASVAGQIGSQTDPPYSASKAANINFAQCMAKDLAGQGIRVNVVCPGMVQTTLNRSVWQAWNEQTPESERLSYEVWADRKIRKVVPLGRWQSAEDVAAMIVFLSSDRAAQVTGQTINVDGGFVMHW